MTDLKTLSRERGMPRPLVAHRLAASRATAHQLNQGESEMKKRVAALVAIVCLSTGCAGTIQSASMIEAHKKYNQQDFEETLELISRAESAQTLSPQHVANLTYLKALTYEGLGEPQRAVILYEYLLEQHPGSQYAYMAEEQLRRHAL